MGHGGAHPGWSPDVHRRHVRCSRRTCDSSSIQVFARGIPKAPQPIGCESFAWRNEVNITPCAGFVEPLGALGVGAIGALACVFAARGLKKLNLVDDSLDCFSLHGVGGFVGAILGGFFDTEDGIIYGGGALLLGKNVAGAAFGVVYSAAVTAVIYFIMRLVMRMRVSEEQELEGRRAAGTFRLK